jgi:hypothetical protein
MNSKLAVFGLVIAGLLLSGQAQAHSPGPPFLKGISTVQYDDYFEGRLDGTNRCTVNQSNWSTALRFVANQSVRLKFVPREEYWRRLKELGDKASSLTSDFSEKGAKAYETAQNELSNYVDIPSLFIVVTIIELDSGCAGTLQAELSANAASTKLRHTGRDIGDPSIVIWHHSSWFKGPHAGFARQVIDYGEGVIKKLVNDWTDAQKN